MGISGKNISGIAIFFSKNFSCLIGAMEHDAPNNPHDALADQTSPTALIELVRLLARTAAREAYARQGRDPDTNRAEGERHARQDQ